MAQLPYPISVVLLDELLGELVGHSSSDVLPDEDDEENTVGMETIEGESG